MLSTWLGLSIVVLSGMLILVRFNKARISRSIWVLYGYTYDGLLKFWPYAHLIELVFERLEVKPGQKILDLGCGTGNLLKKINAEEEVTAVGVDLSKPMLAAARRKLTKTRSGWKLVNQNILAFLTEQGDQSFDRIVSVNVFYALTDRRQIWQELLRVIKTDGRIVITTSVRTGSWPIFKEHLEHASVWQLMSLRLVGVLIVDLIINGLGRSGTFAFPDEATLRAEVEAAGGRWVDSEPCYGGVNTLFTVMS